MPGDLSRDPFPEVATSYRVEVDGAMVWERQPDRRLPTASLTKLMTALLVVEQNQLQATATVGVSRSAAQEGGTRIGIRPGENSASQTCSPSRVAKRASCDR